MNSRRNLLIGIAGLVAVLTAACSVQETNTYPVDIFTEMHYSQALRAQEPPRLQTPAESVAYSSAGGPDDPLEVRSARSRAVGLDEASDLYRVNCSVCHGVTGLGDGPAVPHLRSNTSFYSTTTGQVMGQQGARRLPPNLQEVRQNLNEDAIASAISAGGFQASVMPRFEKFLTQEEIWGIAAYILDANAGLGSSR